MTAQEYQGMSGLMLISQKTHSDNRGSFEEHFNCVRFEGAGLPGEFVQDNISFSKANALRGLHIQRNNPQGKLVRVIKGVIYDVCVDLRPDSKTFMEYRSVILSGANGQSLYIPPGFAHGFLAMYDSVVLYKCTTLYDSDSDGGINWNDEDLKIPWWAYIEDGQPIISEKDQALPYMKDYLRGL